MFFLSFSQSHNLTLSQSSCFPGQRGHNSLLSLSPLPLILQLPPPRQENSPPPTLSLSLHQEHLPPSLTMLTCIACSKQISRSLQDFSQADDDLPDDQPPPRPAIKALTNQMRDMAVKATGAYRHCRPCNGFLESERRSDSCRIDEAMLGRPEDLPEELYNEWVAQVEPGVLITLFSLPYGKNDLRRIRFNREMFDRIQAQRWWAENCDKIMELYNIHRLHRGSIPLSTPPRSEDEISQAESAMENPVTPPISEQRLQKFAGRGKNSTPEEGSPRTSEEEEEREWVEQDEPGVYITIRGVAGGGRELRRVRFSRERFNEMHARVWWEENRSRVHKQYL